MSIFANQGMSIFALKETMEHSLQESFCTTIKQQIFLLQQSKNQHCILWSTICWYLINSLATRVFDFFFSQ